MVELRVVADVTSLTSILVVLGIYLLIAARLKASRPALAMLFGISGVATAGRLPRAVIHHEASLAFLAAALFSHFALQNYLLHSILEAAFGGSFLLLSLIVLRAFLRQGGEGRG